VADRLEQDYLPGEDRPLDFFRDDACVFRPRHPPLPRDFGLASHAMEQAFELAELFSQALHKRAKAAGFIKTLLQRRVGSSLEAGLKTTRKILAGRDLEDDETEEEAESIYPLNDAEKDILHRLEDHLARHLERESDPKFERVRQVLQ
jgi:hypothetical protein